MEQADTPASEMLQESLIVSASLSESSLKKKLQAKQLLENEAATYRQRDPNIVSKESSRLVLNILFKYSGLAEYEKSGKASVLKGRDAVNGIVSGLRWLYRDAGHTDNWQVVIGNDGSVIAHGNPLEGNLKIREFRNMHAKKLSEVGRVVRTAPPLAPEHIIEHGKRFLVHYSGDVVDKKDIELHAFLLTAMNCGMRYDELSKVRIENVTSTKYGIEFGIGERCKNSTGYRAYVLRRWPGDAFSKCILMDPLFAFTSWLLVRGNLDGYLFCDILGNVSAQRLILHEPWSRKSFVACMQGRFAEIGIGSGIARSHTGHSPKRGGVQILRFLGCKDLFIMNWFGMTGQTAYLRYTEGFNDAAGVPVPDFASSEAMLAHARARTSLEDSLQANEESQVRDWLADIDVAES